jgi:hypothetical protein
MESEEVNGSNENSIDKKNDNKIDYDDEEIPHHHYSEVEPNKVVFLKKASLFTTK